jgi:Mor family transcriptional regulator
MNRQMDYGMIKRDIQWIKNKANTRDLIILKAYSNGASVTILSKDLGISRARIYAIINRYKVK